MQCRHSVTINPIEYIAECIVFFVSTASRVAQGSQYGSDS